MVRLDIDHVRLGAWCRKWQVADLALFGSVLRDDFGPDSDVDVLVSFAVDAPWTLMDVVRAEGELSSLLGRPVDLVERRAVEQGGNFIRRRAILETAERVFPS
ncbi:MAG: nucleotidyltransferase domain-containing protein [Planctomycetes bacterium]|nr:nucleotidyltransferase domain-containing protein [Planctomycetota bacterium]